MNNFIKFEKDANVHCVYKITNLVNKKIYIGRTKKPLTSRLSGHFSNKSNCIYLKNAIKKYGKENFVIEPIIFCEEKDVKYYESYLIGLHNSTDKSKGYNILADTSRGIISQSLEHREKKSKSLKEHYKHNASKTKGKENKAKQQPVYAKGFVFPSRKLCSKVLKITVQTFNRMLKRREIWYLDAPYTPYQEAYNLQQYEIKEADKRFKLEQEKLRKQVRALEVRENSSKRLKTKNPAFHSGKHIRQRRISIHGVEYASIRVASELSGFTKRQIEKRLKKQVGGFIYLDDKYKPKEKILAGRKSGSEHPQAIRVSAEGIAHETLTELKNKTGLSRRRFITKTISDPENYFYLDKENNNA